MCVLVDTYRGVCDICMFRVNSVTFCSLKPVIASAIIIINESSTQTNFIAHSWLVVDDFLSSMSYLRMTQQVNIVSLDEQLSGRLNLSTFTADFGSNWRKRIISSVLTTHAADPSISPYSRVRFRVVVKIAHNEIDCCTQIGTNSIALIIWKLCKESAGLDEQHEWIFRLECLVAFRND